jgi:hypothetical protein
MFFNEDKNIAFYNNQALDTYHEIIVSFDYARYSKNGIPSGGFSVSFYRSSFDRPRGGGPDFSLGYLPNKQSEYCRLGGYPGLEGAMLAVGFDSIGNFSVATDQYNGLSRPTPNTVTIRQGFEENYNYVSTSKNLINTPIRFKIADEIQDDSQIKWKSVRIIISNGFTQIKVQVKEEWQKDFFTVLESRVGVKARDAVKAAIISTTNDNDTEFDIRNFNVAGFPGTPKVERFGGCLQIDNLFGYSDGNTIVTGNDFIAAPINGDINIYKLKNSRFEVDQVLSETTGMLLLGGSNKFLFGGLKNSTSVVIYYNNENKFFRSQEINIYEDARDLPNGERYIDFPVCAHTDDSTCAIGNNRYVSIYDYFGNTSDGSIFGTWIYTQSLFDELTGGLGASLRVEDDKLLAGSLNSFVNFYTYDGAEWVLDSTIFSPYSGNEYARFGASLALRKNDLIIGAPYEFKRRYTTVGQGEAYHYYYSLNPETNTRRWRKIMDIGNFFLINTPGGNFGTHLEMKGNNLIISAPYENYLEPPSQVFEDIPNCGRVYFFRKTGSGIFTQSNIVAPGAEFARPYFLYGRFVGLFDNYIGVSIAQSVPGAGKLPSEINFINIDCTFPTPPIHIPIPADSISLVDNAGYAIDIETLTLMQLISASTFYTQNDLTG